MKGPGRVIAAAAALWIAVACLDITSPVTGIASITNIILPTPSVVENDSSRDTIGRLDSLRVVAFAPNGDTVRDAVIRYFVIDSTQQLHVDSVSGIASADTLSPLAKVFARVTPANGKGVVQTVLMVPLMGLVGLRWATLAAALSNILSLLGFAWAPTLNWAWIGLAWVLLFSPAGRIAPALRSPHHRDRSALLSRNPGRRSHECGGILRRRPSDRIGESDASANPDRQAP